MRTVLITLFAVSMFITAYIIWLRPYLKSLPSLAAAWRNEDSTLAAIKAWLDGRKTVLAAIWGEVVALGPDVLQSLSGVDLKTLLSLPDAWAGIVSFVVMILVIVFRVKASST